MRLVRVLSAAALGLIILAPLSGCGAGRHKTVPVEGQVLWSKDGKPVEGATVTFEADNLPSASGITNSEGKFKLTTYTNNDGAVPGDYKVTIVKAAKAGGGSGLDLKNMSPEERTKAMTGQMAGMNDGGRTESKDELPKEYQNKEKSGLKVQVPSSTPIVFKIRETGGGSD
jgi:hypothetical protein